MVRLKHRYLLVNILYPEDGETPKHSRVRDNETTPYALQYRRPSDDRVDGRLLARLIRDGVSELFGDYGSGMIAGSLQGMSPKRMDLLDLCACAKILPSQILLCRDEHGNRSGRARPLPACVVRSHVHDASAQAGRPTLCDPSCQGVRYDQEGRGGSHSSGEDQHPARSEGL